MIGDNGQPVVENGSYKLRGGKVGTLEAIVAKALLSPYKGEEDLSLDKRMERYDLWRKLKGQFLPVEITGSEATLIKAMVAKLFGGALISGRVRDIIALAEAEAIKPSKLLKELEPKDGEALPKANGANGHAEAQASA